MEDNKPLDGDDHAKHAHSARTADMQGTLQSVPALTATFSALVLFTGIVYNIGYFFPFNLQLLSLLTVSEFLFSPIVATYFMIILTIVVWTILFSFILFLRSLLAKVWLHIFLSLFMVGLVMAFGIKYILGIDSSTVERFPDFIMVVTVCFVSAVILILVFFVVHDKPQERKIIGQLSLLLLYTMDVLLIGFFMFLQDLSPSRPVFETAIMLAEAEAPYESHLVRSVERGVFYVKKDDPPGRIDIHFSTWALVRGMTTTLVPAEGGGSEK